MRPPWKWLPLRESKPSQRNFSPYAALRNPIVGSIANRWIILRKLNCSEVQGAWPLYSENELSLEPPNLKHDRLDNICRWDVLCQFRHHHRNLSHCTKNILHIGVFGKVAHIFIYTVRLINYCNCNIATSCNFKGSRKDKCVVMQISLCEMRYSGAHWRACMHGYMKSSASAVGWAWWRAPVIQLLGGRVAETVDAGSSSLRLHMLIGCPC